MRKRDDLMAQYVEDLKNKCGMTPYMVLPIKVTIGCCSAIYNIEFCQGLYRDNINAILTLIADCAVLVAFCNNRDDANYILF